MGALLHLHACLTSGREEKDATSATDGRDNKAVSRLVFPVPAGPIRTENLDRSISSKANAFSRRASSSVSGSVATMNGGSWIVDQRTPIVLSSMTLAREATRHAGRNQIT